MFPNPYPIYLQKAEVLCGAKHLCQAELAEPNFES